jgi:hypothetical protein
MQLELSVLEAATLITAIDTEMKRNSDIIEALDKDYPHTRNMCKKDIDRLAAMRDKLCSLIDC